MIQLETIDKINKKVNDALLLSIFECVEDVMENGKYDSFSLWNNSYCETLHFDLDMYIQGDGRLTKILSATNIVITLQSTPMTDYLGFRVIDIYNNKIHFCLDNGYHPHTEIKIDSSTEIDEGFIFQLHTTIEKLPLNVEHLKSLQRIGSALQDDFNEE